MKFGHHIPCSVCGKYFPQTSEIYGTSSCKGKIFKRHEESEQHRKALELERLEHDLK